MAAIRSHLVLLLVALSIGVAYSSINSNYPTINASGLKKIFDSAKPYADLSGAFYSIKGNALLGETLSTQNAAEVCNFIKSKVDKSNIESVFYATSLAGTISNCVLPVADFETVLNTASSSAKVVDLFYYVLAANNLKKPIDSKKISKSVLDGLKADSSILNQGYSLQIATLLSENQKAFYDNIEDILEQADEVDKKYLQYEGGVGTTSLILDGIFELSAKLKNFPEKFTQERLTKFVNYLTSKRFPTNIKSAFFLLKFSKTLANNQFHIPLILSRISPVGLSTNQAQLVVSLTNILGEPVKQAQFNLEAESGKSQKTNGGNLISAKKPFTSKSSDGTTFEIKLIDGQLPAAGFYTVAVSASPKAPHNADKRFFLVTKSVEVKVTTQASISDLQIGVADRDQSAPKLTKLEENKSLGSKLEADQQTKLYVKFTVKDKVKSSTLEAQQTFVRFTHVKSGREIVFLAQAASGGLYQADVDFATQAKNFRQLGGLYSLELLVSDALIDNPIRWKLGEVNLQLAVDSASASPSSDELKAALYSAKPEIKHLFRPAEPVPPQIVSLVFSALSAAPLLLLFILWLKIGFNFSRFSFSLWGILFHATLAAIFGLFYCYWVKLNMFQTLQYLAILGLVALITGNKLLRGLAASKEKKKSD